MRFFLAAILGTAFVSSQNVFLPSDLFGNTGESAIDTMPTPPSIITLPSDNQISTVANDFGSFTLNLPPLQNPTGTPTTSTETTTQPSIFDNVNLWPTTETTTTPEPANQETENIIEVPNQETESVIESQETIIPVETINTEQETPATEINAEQETPAIEINAEQETVPTFPVDIFNETPVIAESDVVLGEEVTVGESVVSLVPETPAATTEPAASTIQCNFGGDGQIQCQTCYYQAGCNDPNCPIDYCE